MKTNLLLSQRPAVSSQLSAISKKKWLVAIIVLLFTIHYSLFTNYSYSQAVISATPSTPNGSAMLDVQGTGFGVLIPRMTTAERDQNILLPVAPSLLIFNTTTNCFESYVNDGWKVVSCPTTCVAPAVPALIAPTQIACTSFIATWTGISPAPDHYLIDVSTSSGFTDWVFSNNDPNHNLIYHNCNVGNGTSALIDGLDQNGTYYYRVRSFTTCPSAVPTSSQQVILYPQGFSIDGTFNSCNSITGNLYFGLIEPATIYYSLDGTTNPLGTIPNTDRTYLFDATNDGITSNTDYQLTFWAKDGCGGNLTNTATVAIHTPTCCSDITPTIGVNVIENGTSSVTINWSWSNLSGYCPEGSGTTTEAYPLQTGVTYYYPTFNVYLICDPTFGNSGLTCPISPSYTP